MKEAGDMVLAIVHSVGRGRGSGLEIDRESAMVWQIPDETLLALTFYRELSAAGNSRLACPFVTSTCAVAGVVRKK
jgi:hypothetical protein